MLKNSVQEYAKKSFLALKNPYDSVEKVYTSIIDEITEDTMYLGVKNVSQIPVSFIKDLKIKGNYLLHTLDAHAFGGRAIDLNLKNPISGRPMTGSSSGTAINVLLGINDLGIGTDGGGSVLAPAMSVNLYGFISHNIYKKELDKYPKISTDNIAFTPSIGYITRTFKDMHRIIHLTMELPEVEIEEVRIGFLNEQSQKNVSQTIHLDFKSIILDTPDILGARTPLVQFLKNRLPDIDFIVSEEGPIDFYGMGDSILGHFDDGTHKEQREGNKGLIRVANMANATAITIPQENFASSYVLICESHNEKISKMLAIAEMLQTPEDKLLQRYFRGMDNYFGKDFDDL